MRYLSDVTIEHAIAHHLDHLIPEKIISHRPLKISEELHLYLSEHIIAVSRLSSLVPAQFKNHGETGDVAFACRAILSGEGKFSPQSAKIAEKLFATMGTNRSLSPGLLLIVQAKDNETRKKFIALLKMEAQPIFKEERKEGPDGEISIELTIDPIALPSPGRHLQKCALIKAEHSPAQPEILLIDKQARESAVAGFFHEHFLQAEYCRDSHFRTKKFVREFVKWANRARQEHRLTPEQLDDTIGAARDAGRRDKISIPEFVEQALPHRGHQSDCIDTLAKRNVDIEVKFETDHRASERFSKVQMIKLDHNAAIRLPLTTLLDTEFYSVESHPDDPTISVITIRTRKYQVT